MARLERGFVGSGGAHHPPKSDKGFVWPNRAATDQQRMALRKNLARLIPSKAPNHREFARLFYGEIRSPQGYVQPRTPGTVVKYLSGDSFPDDNTAQQLAAFFRVPMQQLVTDDGQPYVPLPMIRPKGASKTRLKKMNGHAGNGAAGMAVVSHGAPAPGASEPSPPKPPKGSKAITVEIKTVAGAPEWCHVAISGTVPLDVALGLMAFIERGTHRGGPRK